MIPEKMPAIDRHGNLQKHLNPNPVQRWLLNRFHASIVKQVGKTGARTILDAGCAQGFVMHELAQADAALHVSGIDLDAEALAWNHGQHAGHWPLGMADVRRLPFPDHSFDLVLSLEVLEHLPKPQAAVREFLRVSRGPVLVSVPHEPWFRTANFVRGRHIRAWGNDPEHIQNFSGAAFRRMLESQARLVWHGYQYPWQIALLEPA